MTFSDFRHRFEVLLAPEQRSALAQSESETAVKSSKSESEIVAKILDSLDIESSSYRVGLSRVFFRDGTLGFLERDRDEKISSRLVAMQSLCRGFLQRKRLQQLKLQHLAVQCIQRNVVKFKTIEQWPWWRLFNKVKPLLNVHRTEEELQLKEVTQLFVASTRY